MSDDPLIQRLTQLQPDGGELDRDALLFAAGRASVRPNRGWQALAATLAAAQLVTLTLFLWPSNGAPVKLAPAPGPEMAVAPPAVRVDPPPPISEDGGGWALRERLLEGDGKFPPIPAVDLVDSPEEDLGDLGPLMFQHLEGHKR